MAEAEISAENLNATRIVPRWAMVVFWLLMILFAMQSATHMVGAGDTWVAMACGRHFINHGVDTNEPFSANSHREGPTEAEVATWPSWAQKVTDIVGLETVKKVHPTGWVNQNWLTHTFFYWLTHLSPFADAESKTFNSLVYWKFAIYIITVIAVYYTGRVYGVHPALSAAFACFALYIGRTFYDIRPAGFSNMNVALLLLIFALTTHRHYLYIWLLLPLTVIWCNLHGGFIYVPIVLVPFIGVHFLMNLPKAWRAGIYYSGVALAFIYIMMKLVTAADNKTASVKSIAPGEILTVFVFFSVAVICGFIMLFREPLIKKISWRGVWHCMAAAVVTFAATLIFNPFHLTNYTHTFIVSISEHAELWRTVNEWHPSFEWSNPVGDEHPFFIQYIMLLGIMILGAFAWFMNSRCVSVRERDLPQLQKGVSIMVKLFGYGALIVSLWLGLLSTSLAGLSFQDFVLLVLFALVIIAALKIHPAAVYAMLPLMFLTLLMSKGKGSPADFGGRYIYIWLIVPVYVIFSFAAGTFDNIKRKSGDVIHAVVAGVLTFILVSVTINPFGLDLSAGIFADVFTIQRIWEPIYVYKMPLWYSLLIPGLYVINIIAVAAWFNFACSGQQQQDAPQMVKMEGSAFAGFDMAAFFIALLTAYMAVKSRRFITLSGIVACPVLAWLLGAVANSIRSSAGFAATGKRLAKPFTPKFGKAVGLAALFAFVVFGGFWGHQFYRVYLGPSPDDPKLTSVFMRMTASHVKPFYACEFIRENNLSGKMFNYWTEGGFIAYGQNPDPNTGRTPLQLFMDGRAQAAYNTEDYRHWMTIMSGGPTVARVRNAKRRMTASDFKEMGEWIDAQFERENVWVVLMPLNQFNSNFVRGLSANRNWPVAFMNQKQKLFVDIDTEQGKKLFTDVLTGKAYFPDDFSRNLTLGHNRMLMSDKKAVLDGFEHLKKAFEEIPCSISAYEIYNSAGRYSFLRDEVTGIFEDYMNEFEENSVQWQKENHYSGKLGAASLASSYLSQFYSKSSPQLAESYKKIGDKIKENRRQIVELSRW